MKDVYPPFPTIPARSLVPAEMQPDYADVPEADATAALAEALAGRHVDAGHGDAVAIIHHDTGVRSSFAELAKAGARLGNALRSSGVRPGDRVAVRSTNRPEAIHAVLAAWHVGAVVVPTPLQARASELRFFFEDTGAETVIADMRDGRASEIAEAVRGTSVERIVGFGSEDHPFDDWSELVSGASERFEGPTPDPDGLALIWHTGGTTGTPKACYHTRRRFLLGGHAVGAATGVRRGERWAAAAPVGHALGFIYHTIYTLLHGATIVMIERFNRAEDLLTAIAAHDVDTFTAVVATWARLKATIEASGTDRSLASIKRAYGMWQSSSSSEIGDWLQQRGIELLNNFGSTSFATWVLVPRPGEACRRGSLGRPAPGYDVIAIDPDAAGVVEVPTGAIGRMAVRGPTGLTYWNRLDQQHRDVVDGWTLVDDLIRFGDDGNAEYLGRIDYLISTAGYKVAPVEVERTLCAHPLVREVAVLGAPDPIRQEVVAAFVVLETGVIGDDALRLELQSAVKAQLSPYKYPRRIEFLSALPRDGVGKVQMKILRELVHAQPADVTSE
jgi:2-aminobenzoate-CoA ligase